MPLGGISVIVLLGLLIAPLGKWLTQAPLLGSTFEQICRVTNAACNPATLTNNPDSQQKTIFSCVKGQDVSTTFARIPKKGSIPVIHWVSKYFEEAGYTPEIRCEEVSKRFQALYDKGLLNYITTDRMKGQNVVCVAFDNQSPCISDGLLFTLKPDAKPNEVIRSIFALEYSPARGPLLESERIYIPIQQILEKKALEQEGNE